MPEPLDRLTAALTGHYRIERQLGSGGMATVYLAEDLKHHRQVALKVLRPELAAVLGPERFLREIEIAAKLNHPHILPVFDSGEAAGVLYYVMPYVAGESLRDRLNREKQLGIEDALQIAREVADALDYAHRQGVVHRDIKPENILLEERHAVVADFGIARAISVAGGEKLTATGVAVGTPEYMSPEQASGRGELDGRSDIYALGCVLYEMLAGQPPFTGPTVEGVLRQHLIVTPPAVTAIREAVPGSVTYAVQRAMAKSPADRFSSADELASLLSRSLTDTARPSIRNQLPNRKTAFLAVLALALIMAGVSWLSRRTGTGGPGEVRTAPRIVVLPFTNLGAPEDASFADGMTEEISGRLARLSGLAVIASASAVRYRGTNKAPRQIAAELRADYVLGGTVRWERSGDSAGRIRISTSLIRAKDETQVWAEPYEEDWGEGVFRLQADVAERVAGALNLTLLASERRAVAAVPTLDMTAYGYYLRGLAYRVTAAGNRANAELAVEMFARATERDSLFALAFARLAFMHTYFYWYWDQTDARLQSARKALAKAVELAPDLPETYVARGFLHYYGNREYEQALEQFARARRLNPNDPEVFRATGLVQRRLGQWPDAVASLTRATELDPASSIAAADLGWTLTFTRHYERARVYLERSLAAAPDNILGRVWTAILWTLMGDVAKSRAILREGGVRTLVAIGSGPLSRLLDEGLYRAYVEAHGSVARGPRSAALLNYYLTLARLHQRRGAMTLARAYYDSLRIDAAAQLVPGQPTEATLRSLLGLALAGLGRSEEGIQQGREGVGLMPLSKDAMDASGPIITLAEIYVMVGDYDAALEQIERALSIPSLLSVPLLRIDPLWDPLRNNPRFQALLAKYQN